MTSFSSILSSIGAKPQAPQQPSTTQQKPSLPSSEIRKLTTATNSVKLAPNNAAAGVKRKSEEPESAPRPKTAKTEPEHAAKRPPLPTAPSSRFQLSGKGGTTSKAPGIPQSSNARPSSSSGPQRPMQHPISKPIPKLAQKSSPTPPSTAHGAPPAKRGFASIMERAKAAQEVAKTTGSSSIKHKPVEKMTKRERLRMMEEAKAQQKGPKRRKQGHFDRSRSATPVTAKPGPTETSFKGTMKKKAEPLAYKGTMRKVGPGDAKDKSKAKGQAQDKYGGYASWSDLDDAEEDEDGYGSDASSDMEGGFDDVEQEETLATRAARQEDQKALEDEEAHRKEKLARKRRLEELSKNAAAKRKY